MTGILHFETFLLTGILLNLTPGNDTIYILTKSIMQGRKAGIISTFGIATGSLVHTLFAAFGLSLVIANSILVFNIIKFAGAAYLIYLGYKMLTDKLLFNAELPVSAKSVDFWKIYRDAILTNILNPKVALFFISFLPQFIDPSHMDTVLPFLTLGATFITTGTIWCLTLAVFASEIFKKIKSNNKVSIIINKFCGLTLVGLGINMALTTRK